mmetsp:Transcript_26108/g.48685  ORF Transcript_26108/g.48685 Transcript_26108/m.48685 type:complete len:262 (-) Transcript_26108:66-851(-)
MQTPPKVTKLHHNFCVAVVLNLLLPLAIEELTHEIFGNLFLPFIAVREKLFLIVQKFLVSLGCKFKVWAFNDGIHGTCFLAKSTIDALCHIDIVTSGSTSSVLTGFRFNGDGLSGANGLTEFAGDATFISCWVSSQRMLSTKARAQKTMLVWVVDRHLRLRAHFQSKGHTTGNLCDEKELGSTIENGFPGGRKNIVFVLIWVRSLRRSRSGCHGPNCGEPILRSDKALNGRLSNNRGSQHGRDAHYLLELNPSAELVLLYE